VNTHLEHRWEALRLQQLEAAFKTGVIDGTQMTIVVGDFNALCPHDYTPDYLQQVQQTRFVLSVIFNFLTFEGKKASGKKSNLMSMNS
jgi:endonuclease/exonuclease/phosphatase family metal-dependent hydrolase